ncbi:hypothetical protein SNE40_001939 [Patella caerulea]|uniref:Right handed beta helix domain-containing protein n=1 Tax=Patella caerulea TaxID=87958 RepID=A0AAN8K076_PATCE
MFKAIIFTLSLSGILAETVHLYVSPTGSDDLSNKGLSSTSPLKTLHRARDRLDDSDIKGKQVFVELMKGYHDLTTTLSFSHGYASPVTFRSYQHQEVHLTGGRRIRYDLFTPVTNSNILKIIPQVAHSKVRQVHLPEAGITDYGKLSTYGFYTHRTAPLEIFINGNPLHLAEWPNDNYINIKSTPDGGSGLRFTHNSSRDARWTGEKDPWVYGFWQWGWADWAVQVKSINTKSHQITLANNPKFGIRVGSLRYDGVLNVFSHQGGYFRVINMLSELDAPGEYYLDRTTGILYLWPNTPSGTLQQTDIVYVSMVDTCINLNNAQNIHFEDFTLEACRHYGFEGNNARNIKFTNLEIKNTGSYGISCSGDCRSITVSKCDIHHTDGGVSIKGGNRNKLESSGNILEDNHIWKFGRATKVGANGISPGGVNTLMKYNYLHDGPYTCIRWAGNDHIMEYNHFSRCCHDSSDCGAIHAGRDWTMRGNVIRYNYVHDSIRHWPGADVRGIMLDDEYSSVTIEHNVFYYNEVHVNIGGGRDNIIRYNVFYNATKESVQVDGRGMRGDFHDELTAHLQAVPYTSPIWAAKYPKLAALATSKTRGYPEGNEIYRNIYYNEKGIPWIFFQGKIDEDKYFRQYENRHSFSATDFTSDYHLQCTAKDWANGVNFPQPITLDKVGPRYPYGPKYLNKGKRPDSGIKAVSTPGPCVSGTVAPETNIPKSSYLPDGSGPNNLVTNITQIGCWLLVNSCSAHKDVQGTFRDTYGEQHEQTATNEAKCLARAAEVWRYCGSAKNQPVTVVYGPTGAMTMGGDGCFFAYYGCSSHHYHHVGFERDTWAEQNDNAANDEEKCLKRAAIQWVYCGKDRQGTVTSIYRPTGAFRTGGAGCWIKVPKCPADKTVKYYFYDRWGATNLGTDDDESECWNRASYFWRKCGSHPENPVTAFYRPTGVSKIVPSA